MNIYHSITAGAVTGACLAFAVCVVKDLSLMDALYRMFIVSIGGGWIGFLLAWLNMILPRVSVTDKPQQEHRT